jgi:hypothetical protein
MSEPTILAILSGSHGYSVDPETETGWCRVCMLVGLIVGLVLGLVARP